jgi:threonine/homoserine/homoserine lactone efflux protein
MEGLSATLGVLTAMITPAVLISACGTMILSTSSRLGRVVDRVRGLSDKLEELAHYEGEIELLEERRAVIFAQLDRLTSRARILQRSMTVFYLALGIFVFTSVAIGTVAVTAVRYSWVPIVIALIGAAFLFYGSILLIFEARLALSTIHIEMDFIWRFTKHFAPAELVEQHKPHYVHFRKHERK